MSRIITLTTDFGTHDEYVGVMKGVILGRAPQALLVDISHHIRAHDIRQAAALIAAGYSFFPAGTIHVVVVDPGVGGGRKIILVTSGGHHFLAPDNGLLTQLLAPDLFQSAFEVECEELFLKPVSRTFHGRDIFAPVAAALANAMKPEDVGRSLNRQELVTLTRSEPVFDLEQNCLTGTITRIDRFGNLATNVTVDHISRLFPDLCHWEGRLNLFCVIVKATTIIGPSSSYDQVQAGELLFLINSRGELEIAANRDNAAESLSVSVGEHILVTTLPDSATRKGVC